MTERFQHLTSVLSSDRFLHKQGLGNEVPFFICPFDPIDAVAMDRTRQALIKSLSQQGVEILDISLYDLSIELLQARGIWNQLLEMEQTVSKDELKELLQGVLDPEAHIVPAIAQKMEDATFDVLFLSGIGEVFPYIRSHNVLNNLQSTAKEQPTVLFFPGAYEQSAELGASLNLFKLLEDDKYYRAFNIYDYEI
ncbi:DUF1788 domain-containing protein [cf. Phormidesmis sp. LEGE 11477]|nr:DUF1788 domain-containing protein [cf. Phormidesmis sp. LEGE 11477]